MNAPILDFFNEEGLINKESYIANTDEKVTKWDDKYIGIKEYEQLGKDGEKYRKEHGR